MNIFVLKAFGWCFPGISGVRRSGLLLAERSSFSLISCSARLIIMFFYSACFASYFFLFCSFCQLFFFYSARFASCFLTFQLLPANLVFLPNTILNLFAIFSSFLCSKLNFPPFPANLPPVHYLRNGSALAFPTNCFVLDAVSSTEIWAWLISSAAPSTPTQRYSSQLRSAVQCPTMPCSLH